MKAPSCSIVIPAYNEANRISNTLTHICAFLQEKGWDAEVLVVDDGSTDATALVVQTIAESNPLVRLIHNRVNQGKGRAIRDGVEQARRDVILFADADDSTPIADAEELLGAIAAGADIAIGSRWVDSSLQVTPQPWYRRLNGRVYNFLLRSILGLKFKDTQNGFKAYSREAAKTIFPLQRIRGWGFDAEVLYLAQRFGFKVAEVPVEYIYYPVGSKIRPYRDGMNMIKEMLQVRWFGLCGVYPRGVRTGEYRVGGGLVPTELSRDVPA